MLHYELVAPITPFKTTWADHQRIVYGAVVTLGLRGRLAAPFIDGARARLKRLPARLPSKTRTAILSVRDRPTHHVDSRRSPRWVRDPTKSPERCRPDTRSHEASVDSTSSSDRSTSCPVRSRYSRE